MLKIVITGPKGSGKSNLAQKIEQLLIAEGRTVNCHDSDLAVYIDLRVPQGVGVPDVMIATMQEREGTIVETTHSPRGVALERLDFAWEDK